MIVIDNEMKSDFFVREIRTENYSYAQEIFKEFAKKKMNCNWQIFEKLYWTFMFQNNDLNIIAKPMYTLWFEFNEKYLTYQLYM